MSYNKMESKTTETKNISPKAPCVFCGKLGSKSNVKAHQQTQACQKAQNTGIKYEPKKSIDVLERYREANTEKRKKQLASIGLEKLREKYRIDKRLQRAKDKEDPEERDLEEKQVIELKTNNPTLNKKILQAVNDIKSQGLEIIKIAKTKNTSVIPSLCKKVKDENKTKVFKSIDDINTIKTDDQFTDQFIQTSGIKATSADQYSYEFQKFAKLYLNTDKINYTKLNWLKEYTKVLNYITNMKKPNGKPYAGNTLKKIFTSLGQICSVLGTDYQDVSQKYNKLGKEYNLKYINEQKNNKLSDSQ